MVLRGGSSKGLYFCADDLPGDPADRNRLLLDFMGSPDSRQIDGLGGAHPLTSKVAVVRASERVDADVDYLFLQVSVDDAVVSDRQNCGNLLAGVAPFAIERGLVRVDEGLTTAAIRVYMENTDSNAVATLQVRDGAPVYAGDTTIAGVPGTASPIQLDFADVAGGSTGALLPTGSVIDRVDDLDVTLIDAGMPVVIIRADDLGVTGHEGCDELEKNDDLRIRLDRIRLAAGDMMHLGDVRDATVPKLTLIAAPRAGGDLATRTFIPHRCHDAIGVLGALSVATAARLPGSPAHDIAAGRGGASIGERVLLEHPTGLFEAMVTLDDGPASPTLRRAGFVRTARKLMDGVVFSR